jgi:hypothetical protein
MLLVEPSRKCGTFPRRRRLPKRDHQTFSFPSRLKFYPSYFFRRDELWFAERMPRGWTFPTHSVYPTRHTRP